MKGYLGIAALSISRSKTTYLAVKFRRVQARGGPLKATVAIEHTLLVIIWNMLTTGEAYTELGIDFDYHQTMNHSKAKNRTLRDLAKLGYEVELTPKAVA